MDVPYFVPELDGNELAYVREVLESGWLTTAGKTAEFEHRFQRFVGSNHALAVNSCTAALHLALEAVGVCRGDNVIVPSLTFTASAEVVRYLGAHPIICDVDYTTGLLTRKIVEEALSRYPTVKACIVVHFGGQAASLAGDSGLLGVCQDSNVKLIGDAAHAFPARDEYGYVGAIGDVTCFSFYANKTITCGEGGMLVTNDESIAERCRIMRMHGINRDVWDRFTSDIRGWEYDVVAAGFKYNLSDVNAAIGLAQLERAEEFRVKRQRCAERYLRNLEGHSSLDIPSRRVPLEWHAWHLFPVVLRGASEELRNGVMAQLAQAGVRCSVHYKPLHRMTYYKKKYHLRPKDFPHSERFFQGEISLPLYPSLSNSQIDYVCETLLKIVES